MSEIVDLEPEDVLKFFQELGKALCIILEFLPSEELSFPIRVSEECTLLFTVSKN